MHGTLFAVVGRRALGLWFVVASVAVGSACSDEPGGGGGGGAKASATLAPTTMDMMIGGTAAFEQSGSGVKLVLTVTKAPPGMHGTHIHAGGSCAADAMGAPAGAAGLHWDPTMAMHGNPASGAHHLGDLGNLTVAADGTGRLEMTSSGWTIGTGAATDVVGHTVIIHAMPDDLVTQPTGNSGGRIACGVINKL